MVEQSDRFAVLLRRSLLAAASLGFVGIVLGCMSLSIGGRTEVVQNEDACYVQNGEVTIPSHQEQDVYYPVPFAFPPHLTISTTFNDCKIVAQCADHFRVKNDEACSRDVTWKARGIRMGTPQALPPVPGPPPLPVPAPGPGPVPERAPAPGQVPPPEPIPIAPKPGS